MKIRILAGYNFSSLINECVIMQSKKMPDILMVDSTVGNYYSLCLSEKLYSKGVKVVLLTTEDRSFQIKPDYSIWSWMPSKKQNKNKFEKLIKFITYLVKIFTFAILHQRTIIHYQFFRSRFDKFGFSLIRIFHKRLVLTAHNVFPHEAKKIDYFINNLLYKSARSIIVHSEYIKNKLMNNFNIEAGKIFIVSHGNFDFYKEIDNKTESAARKELNFKTNDKVMLFFGYIREYKGLDLLLEAFNIVSEKIDNLKLLIAGKPSSVELGKIYNDMINSSGYYNNITYNLNFVPVSDVSKYFKASDVVVLPYNKIDHSGIIHLAYSFGKPVIATRVGDFEEVIEHNKSGFILDSNDPHNLSNWIEIAFSDMDKLKSMGSYCLTLNNTKYSWESIADKTIEIYKILSNNE